MWPFRRRAPIGPDKTVESASAAAGAYRTVANAGAPNPLSAPLNVVTVLTPQQQMELGGLPGAAIAGTIDPALGLDDACLAAGFRVNPAFVDFMQHVIGTFGREHPELQEAARQQGTGSVGIIDLRTPEGPQGRVPLEDIVGFFPVEGGRLGAYHPNDQHVVLSHHGLVRLPPQLHELHIRELMRLRVASEG